MQDHADGREHQHEQSEPIFSETSVRSLLASPNRAGLMGFADEGPDHADADDLLAEDAVDAGRSCSCMERKSGISRTTR